MSAASVAPHAEKAHVSIWLAAARRELALSPPRDMIAFAESDIVLPDGPRKGETFSCDAAPFTALWLAEYLSPRWRRFFIAGSVQSGKTLVGFVAPLLYFLFERQVSVIIGVPVIDLAAGIWEDRILPALRASRYDAYLPRRGEGAKGGKVRTAIRFTNGVSLRFMGAGGGDEQRSSYPAQVVLLTELDKLDTAGEASRETQPYRQIEARTSSYGNDARVYGESTVSIPEGAVWREVHEVGSGTRVFVRCPACGKYLHPERKFFRGWDAATIGAAGREAYYECQHCGEKWSEAARQEALRSPLLVHKTQGWTDKTGKPLTVPRSVTGEAAEEDDPDWPPEVDLRAPGPERIKHDPLPDTNTFGLQFNMFHNPLVSLDYIAERQWQNLHTTGVAGEKDTCQFIWTTPFRDSHDGERLTEAFVLGHCAAYAFGALPPEGICGEAGLPEILVTGVDVQKHWLYWLTLAVRAADETAWVVDYGTLDIVPQEKRKTTVPTRGMVEGALDEVRERAEEKGALSVWVDTNYDEQGWVRPWCEAHDRVYPLVGRGHKQMEGMRYAGKQLKRRRFRLGGGDLLHARRQADRSILWYVESDTLRLQVHAAFRIPLGSPGCWYLPREALRRENQWIARHICAEQFLPELVPGKGEVRKWTGSGKRHDLLDCAAYARAGALYEIEQMAAGGRSASQRKTANESGDWTDRKVRRHRRKR